MFIRKLGPKNSRGENRCPGGSSCPDILELKDGDFAVIGLDITADAQAQLPENAGCGPNERIVRIPRAILVEARNDIPLSV